MPKSLFGGADNVNPAALTSASASRFHPAGLGAVWETATESVATRKHRGAGTISRLGVNVTVNSRANATTFLSRINGVDGTLSVSITGSTTGWFEDTSHSDTLADGDDFCFRSLTGAGAGTVNFTSYVASFDATAGSRAVYGWSASGPTAGSSAMRFSLASSSAFLTGICGRTTNTAVMYATETADAQFRVRSPGTYSRLFTRVITNARTTNSTVTLRVNAVDGTNTVTIPSTTTGLFEDTSHSDTIVADDLVNMRITNDAVVNNLDFVQFGCAYEAVGVTSSDMMGASANANLPLTGANTFCAVIGYTAFTATESVARINAPHAFTWWRARIRVGNNPSAATTLFSRINGVDGTIAINIPATTTGFFEDNSHSDSVLQGNTINYRLSSATATGLQLRQITALSDVGGSAGGSARGRRLQIRTF